MAAGAIPPPLFFERCLEGRLALTPICSTLLLRGGGGITAKPTASITQLSGRSLKADEQGPARKDI
jgi:hypothetical protein